MRDALLGLDGFHNVSVSASDLADNLSREWLITFTSIAEAGDQPLLDSRTTSLLPNPGAGVDVTELVRGRSAPVQRLRIATDATGEFSLGYGGATYTEQMAPADTSAGDLALALRTSLPQLGSVVVERHDDSSSGMSEWFMLFAEYAGQSAPRLEVDTGSLSSSAKLSRDYRNSTVSALDGTFTLEYGQTCEEHQTGVTCSPAVTRALPAHINATQLERELEQLPAIVDVSVSRAKRRGVLNGFVYAITFHEVNYNHTASLTLDTNPKSWTRRAEQWSGAYEQHGDVPKLVVDASGLNGTDAAANVREVVSAATPDAGGVVALEVTQNGQDFSASGIVFEYLPVVRVTSLLPDHGPLDGGTEVIVRGENFRNSALLTCQFGGASGMTVTAARFLNSTTIVCISPPSLTAGLVALAVSNNGAGPQANFSHEPNPTFEFNELVTIESVFPPLGPSSGNIDVRVVGGPSLRATSCAASLGMP